jgi:hypothetical protein
MLPFHVSAIKISNSVATMPQTSVGLFRTLATSLVTGIGDQAVATSTIGLSSLTHQFASKDDCASRRRSRRFKIISKQRRSHLGTPLATTAIEIAECRQGTVCPTAWARS